MDTFSKYQRQLLLKNFGQEQQQKLFDARVLVIGAGGLGCPALLYLAAAGVGTLGIVDFDTVEISNLHRQVLYNENDIGKSKAIVAAEKISQQFLDTDVEIFNVALTKENALEIISSFDLLIDGSDNFSTRYLLNDACVLLNKPLVYGSVYCYEGQVAVFNFTKNKICSTNYRDVFPTAPKENEIPNCSEAGVLGVLPGIIGTMQANEAIKIITGIGEPLINKMLTYNSLDNSFYELMIEKNPVAICPATETAFLNTVYELSCTSKKIEEINAKEFIDLMKTAPANTLLVDIRDDYELPRMEEYPCLSIPMYELESRLDELKDAKQIILFCETGTRSKAAASILQNKTASSLYTLKGGMNEFIKNKKAATNA